MNHGAIDRACGAFILLGIWIFYLICAAVFRFLFVGENGKMENKHILSFNDGLSIALIIIGLWGLYDLSSDYRSYSFAVVMCAIMNIVIGAFIILKGGLSAKVLDALNGNKKTEAK